MLEDVAWVIRLGIAAAEREYARNKQHVHPQSMVGLMAAGSILGQLRSRREAFMTSQGPVSNTRYVESSNGEQRPADPPPRIADLVTEDLVPTPQQRQRGLLQT